MIQKTTNPSHIYWLQTFLPKNPSSFKFSVKISSTSKPIRNLEILKTQFTNHNKLSIRPVSHRFQRLTLRSHSSESPISKIALINIVDTRGDANTPEYIVVSKSIQSILNTPHRRIHFNYRSVSQIGRTRLSRTCFSVTIYSSYIQPPPFFPHQTSIISNGPLTKSFKQHC